MRKPSSTSQSLVLACFHLPFLQPIFSPSSNFLSLYPTFWDDWQVVSSLFPLCTMSQAGRLSYMGPRLPLPPPLCSPYSVPAPFSSLPPLSSCLSLGPPSSPHPKASLGHQDVCEMVISFPSGSLKMRICIEYPYDRTAKWNIDITHCAGWGERGARHHGKGENPNLRV